MLIFSGMFEGIQSCGNRRHRRIAVIAVIGPKRDYRKFTQIRADQQLAPAIVQNNAVTQVMLSRA
jgi:hypothetical protein